MHPHIYGNFLLGALRGAPRREGSGKREHACVRTVGERERLLPPFFIYSCTSIVCTSLAATLTPFALSDFSS